MVIVFTSSLQQHCARNLGGTAGAVIVHVALSKHPFQNVVAFSDSVLSFYVHCVASRSRSLCPLSEFVSLGGHALIM